MQHDHVQHNHSKMTNTHKHHACCAGDHGKKLESASASIVDMDKIFTCPMHPLIII